MVKEIYECSDVFGISRDLPKNYIVRQSIDESFSNSLKRKKHIVIFGSSKQGKTCLRKHCLKEDEFITVHCSNKWSVAEINTNILKRAGFEIVESEKKSATGKNKIVASIKGILPALQGKLEGTMEESVTEEKSIKPLELDIEDVNDIIYALNSINFNKYIILEDFHYLKTETQKDFSIELKAFHEDSKYTFIIIGVWLDENRLTIYNGDLTGRVIAVNADKWSNEELKQAIQKGESLLNIRFDETAKEDIVKGCNDSIYILQEACYRLCEQHGVERTQYITTMVGDGADIEGLIQSIIAEQSGRYNAFITNYADGFQDTKLEMYKWILYAVMKADDTELEKGLKLADIKSVITNKHPKGTELNVGNLTQALKSTASLQVAKSIQPIIIDYDESNRRLQVVDRGFLLWKKHQDIDELLSLIGIVE